MYTTKTQIKKELREELNCSNQFINFLNKWGYIDKLKQALLKDEKMICHDIMKEVYNAYQDYKKDFGL